MICSGGFGRFNPRSALALGLALPFALTAALHERASAQSAVPANLQQRDQELSSTREAQRKSAEAEAVLKREIEEIGADRRKLNQELIDTAARSRDFEAKIAATEARLAPLDENEASIRKSLDGRRAVIGEVLAALQRIGHRPPPALISSPEDALQTVRTAMLLGAVLPEMRQQVDALASDLSELVAVRKKIADERDHLRTEVASLGEQRTRMTALIAERQKQQSTTSRI
jgi:septal ring factor EnvC (AmiA/AmiB activator)